MKLIASLLFAASLYGQATMTSTTTSQAVGVNDSVIYLASLTGINAASPSVSASVLMMDQEAMRVLSKGTNSVTVARGIYGTGQVAHVSGVTVWAGAPELYAFSNPSAGACVSTNLRVLPLVVIPSGAIWDCTAGLWAQRGAGGGGSGNGDPSAYTTVTYSATPTFAVTKNTGHTFLITLTGDATASVDTSGITNSGRPIVTLRICQDSSGSHAFTWPASFLNHGTVDGTASACSAQTFVFDGTNFQALGMPIVTGTTDAILIPGSTSGAVRVKVPAAAGSGDAILLASTNTVAGIANPSDTQVINYIDTSGVQHRIAQSGGGGTAALAANVGHWCPWTCVSQEIADATFASTTTAYGWEITVDRDSGYNIGTAMTLVHTGGAAGKHVSVAIYDSTGTLIDSATTGTASPANTGTFSSHHVLGGSSSTYNVLFAVDDTGIALYTPENNQPNLAYMLTHASDGILRAYTIASQVSWSGGVPTWAGTLGTKAAATTYVPLLMLTY